jgi:hypothetical protein
VFPGILAPMDNFLQVVLGSLFEKRRAGWYKLLRGSLHIFWKQFYQSVFEQNNF